MGKVRVAAFTVSLDGFGAGPNQDPDNPIGLGGFEMMEWMFATDAFHRMHATDRGETGIDNGFAERSFENVGAWVIGRNMFGPIRGPWPDEEWRGWWGDEPPYHVPVFVLTHHPRPVLEMAGNTRFHFITDGLEAALEHARSAAGDKDVRIGGGVSTIRQGLSDRHIDELHLAARPTLLGRGEALFAGIDLPSLGYRVVETTPGELATHVIIRKT